MAVYVDNMEAPYRGMVMCHMLADTEPELHEMAQGIGVLRKWFQSKGSAPHYDICKSKRKLAVAGGALEISMGSQEWREVYHRVRYKRKQKPA